MIIAQPRESELPLRENSKFISQLD